MAQSMNQCPSPNVIYVTTVTSPIPQQTNSGMPSKAQTTSTSAGGIIFLSAGMNLALSVGWFQYSINGSPKHFCYSWFLGVIIGAIVSAPLIHFIRKKYIMAFSTLLILLGGILFTSEPNDYDTLLAGRYFNGIAIGLATIAFLMNASEVAANTNRGGCLTIEQYGVSFGIAVQMTYASYWSFTLDFPINRLHGIVDIVFAVIAAILLLLFIESPIEHIRKGDDAAALDCLSRLRQPKGVNMETRALLDQHKAYVREHESLSLMQSFVLGLVPLVKMIVFRSMMLAFCYSLPLNVALQYSMIAQSHSWAPMVSGCCRIVGAIIAVCLADNVMRKLPSVITVAIIGGLLIGLATTYRTIYTVLNNDNMSIALTLCIVLQAFAGFYTPYTSVYLGEAFPLRAKPFLLVVSVVVEQIIQIIFIASSPMFLNECLMAQGIITVVAFLFLCLTMPETRNTSLSEAQNRFRKFFYFRSTN